MAKLYFRYGAMGASKTAQALMVQHNYSERGQTALLAKPSTDDRGSPRTVESRLGIKKPCMYINELLSMHEDEIKGFADAVIVDEAQFLTSQEVDALSDIVDFLNIPVMCYGLRTDLRTELFPGSKRLFEIADVIEEIPTICWCGKRAHINARIENGEIVTTGEQVLPGGDDKYVTLCRKHFKERRKNGNG